MRNPPTTPHDAHNSSSNLRFDPFFCSKGNLGELKQTINASPFLLRREQLLFSRLWAVFLDTGAGFCFHSSIMEFRAVQNDGERGQCRFPGDWKRSAAVSAFFRGDGLSVGPASPWRQAPIRSRVLDRPLRVFGTLSPPTNLPCPGHAPPPAPARSRRRIPIHRPGQRRHETQI